MPHFATTEFYPDLAGFAPNMVPPRSARFDFFCSPTLGVRCGFFLNPPTARWAKPTETSVGFHVQFEAWATSGSPMAPDLKSPAMRAPCRTRASGARPPPAGPRFDFHGVWGQNGWDRGGFAVGFLGLSFFGLSTFGWAFPVGCLFGPFYEPDSLTSLKGFRLEHACLCKKTN